MKISLLFFMSIFFISCSSNNTAYKTENIYYKDYLKAIREQNKELKSVVGIDTVSIGFMKKYMDIVNKNDSLSQTKNYEITFLTENFNSLNRKSQKNILSFLFKNNFTVHFLGNNYNSNRIFNGIGLMDYIFYDSKKFGYPYLVLNITFAPRGGRGYTCELEKDDGFYKIKNVNDAYIY